MSENWTTDLAANVQIVDLDDTQYIFPALGDLRRNNTRREPYRDEFKHLSGTINGELSFGKLTTSSAFVHRDILSVFDATVTLPDITGDPDAEGVFSAANAIRTFNHETRIVSENSDNLNWLFGGFYSHRKEQT